MERHNFYRKLKERKYKSILDAILTYFVRDLDSGPPFVFPTTGRQKGLLEEVCSGTECAHARKDDRGTSDGMATADGCLTKCGHIKLLTGKHQRSGDTVGLEGGVWMETGR